MALTEVEVTGIGTVTVARRKGTRHLRLSIKPNGKVTVSVPLGVSDRRAASFINSQKDWIAKHRPAEQKPLQPDMPVGKFHRLVFSESPTGSRVTTRIVGSEIRVIHPVGFLYGDKTVQAAAIKAIERVLRKEAQQVLPDRLQTLAAKHGFVYATVAIKRLHTRWGSCSSRQDIVLNSMLMQLPWHLIDYVLLHELLHTQMMRHGAPFWEALARHVPNLPTVRKEMKQYSPTVVSV